MTVLSAIRAANPLLTVWAQNGSPSAAGGSPATSGEVQTIAGLDGEVLRLVDADVTVTEVSEFTADREFSLLAWVRLTPGSATRRVVGRQTGSTWVLLDVDRDGIPVARVASTAGNYSVALRGTNRVDDGQWHLIVLTTWRRPMFGSFGDSGGINLNLWVDTAVARTGYINPGVFGRAPGFRMTTPIIIGRAADGAAPLQGDVGVVAAFTRRLSAATLQSLWSARPDERTGFVGWGIRMG